MRKRSGISSIPELGTDWLRKLSTRLWMTKASVCLWLRTRRGTSSVRILLSVSARGEATEWSTETIATFCSPSKTHLGSRPPSSPRSSPRLHLPMFEITGLRSATMVIWRCEATMVTLANRTRSTSRGRMWIRREREISCLLAMSAFLWRIWKCFYENSDAVCWRWNEKAVVNRFSRGDIIHFKTNLKRHLLNLLGVISSELLTDSIIGNIFKIEKDWKEAKCLIIRCWIVTLN